MHASNIILGPRGRARTPQIGGRQALSVFQRPHVFPTRPASIASTIRRAPARSASFSFTVGWPAPSCERRVAGRPIVACRPDHLGIDLADRFHIGTWLGRWRMILRCPAAQRMENISSFVTPYAVPLRRLDFFCTTLPFRFAYRDMCDKRHRIIALPGRTAQTKLVFAGLELVRPCRLQSRRIRRGISASATQCPRRSVTVALPARTRHDGSGRAAERPARSLPVPPAGRARLALAAGLAEASCR